MTEVGLLKRGDRVRAIESRALGVVLATPEDFVPGQEVPAGQVLVDWGMFKVILVPAHSVRLVTEE